MKKKSIIIANVLIAVAILVFVIIYTSSESRISYQRQIEHFENTTITMAHVTENYLEGEQRICDIWAQYISSQAMTMEEAADYIRSSHVLTNTSAHLVSLDTLTGLSMRPKQGTNDDYAVSYEWLDLLEDVEWIDEVGKSVNVTRAFTNPMNGVQSLAFCNKKRESRSEAFIANPFSYAFAPVQMSDEGAKFLDMPNLQFSVNKDSPNLEMANEFMRFLITSEELNEMAQKKGLMSPTRDLAFNSMYAAFGTIPESRILSPEVIGLTDDAVKQLRQAVYMVGTGAMTIDEAVAAFGTFNR